MGFVGGGVMLFAPGVSLPPLRNVRPYGRGARNPPVALERIGTRADGAAVYRGMDAATARKLLQCEERRKAGRWAP